MANRTRRISGQDWDVREWGPRGAATTVLLLPGGMCSATFFEDIAAALNDAPVRFVGATLPGFGRTPHPMDLSMRLTATPPSPAAS
jgi:pimeloyl-ACP methyl ester carboxylesterase